MTLPLFLLCFISNSVYWSKAEIKCYECYTVNKTVRSCSNFEPSDKYGISCQNSTFCMKKTSELDLPGGNKIRVEERRCAPQRSYLGWKFKIDKWVPAYAMDEKLYEEGCSWEQTNLKAAQTEYCYCSSDYCNGGQRVTEISLLHFTDALSVSFIFTLVILMRSIR